jgi:2-aminobenzoate-CoA ligase
VKQTVTPWSAMWCASSVGVALSIRSVLAPARSDDMIISSGYNIAAPEVEEAVLSHPDVLECAVVGVPDEARGAVVKAVVVVREGVARDDELAQQIQAQVKAVIAPYKYPRVVEFVDALPRTATGKIQRFRLRQGH